MAASTTESSLRTAFDGLAHGGGADLTSALEAMKALIAGAPKGLSSPSFLETVKGLLVQHLDVVEKDTVSLKTTGSGGTTGSLSTSTSAAVAREALWCLVQCCADSAAVGKLFVRQGLVPVLSRVAQLSPDRVARQHSLFLLGTIAGDPSAAREELAKACALEIAIATIAVELSSLGFYPFSSSPERSPSDGREVTEEGDTKRPVPSSPSASSSASVSSSSSSCSYPSVSTMHGTRAAPQSWPPSPNPPLVSFSSSLLRVAVWSLSGLVEGALRVGLPLDLLLPVLSACLDVPDSEVAASACWALSHICDGAGASNHAPLHAILCNLFCGHRTGRLYELPDAARCGELFHSGDIDPKTAAREAVGVWRLAFFAPAADKLAVVEASRQDDARMIGAADTAYSSAMNDLLPLVTNKQIAARNESFAEDDDHADGDDEDSERVDEFLESASSGPFWLPSTAAKLLRLLRHESPRVVKPALRALGNIVCAEVDDVAAKHTHHQLDTAAASETGSLGRNERDFTGGVVNLGLLPLLTRLIEGASGPSKDIVKEACWTLSNVAAGTFAHVQEVIESGCLRRVMMLASDCDDRSSRPVDPAVRIESCWVLLNAMACSNDSQLEILVRCGAVRALCAVVADPSMLGQVIEALDKILQVGERLSAAALATVGTSQLTPQGGERQQTGKSKQHQQAGRGSGLASQSLPTTNRFDVRGESVPIARASTPAVQAAIAAAEAIAGGLALPIPRSLQQSLYSCFSPDLGKAARASDDKNKEVIGAPPDLTLGLLPIKDSVTEEVLLLESKALLDTCRRELLSHHQQHHSGLARDNELSDAKPARAGGRKARAASSLGTNVSPPAAGGAGDAGPSTASGAPASSSAASSSSFPSASSSSSTATLLSSRAAKEGDAAYRRAAKLWSLRFDECALCERVFSRSAVGVTRRCDECRITVCEACDCSRYHLSRQLELLDLLEGDDQRPSGKRPGGKGSGSAKPSASHTISNTSSEKTKKKKHKAKADSGITGEQQATIAPSPPLPEGGAEEAEEGPDTAASPSAPVFPTTALPSVEHDEDGAGEWVAVGSSAPSASSGKHKMPSVTLGKPTASDRPAKGGGQQSASLLGTGAKKVATPSSAFVGGAGSSSTSSAVSHPGPLVSPPTLPAPSASRGVPWGKPGQPFVASSLTTASQAQSAGVSAGALDQERKAQRDSPKATLSSPTPAQSTQGRKGTPVAAPSASASAGNKGSAAPASAFFASASAHSLQQPLVAGTIDLNKAIIRSKATGSGDESAPPAPAPAKVASSQAVHSAVAKKVSAQSAPATPAEPAPSSAELSAVPAALTSSPASSSSLPSEALLASLQEQAKAAAKAALQSLPYPFCTNALIGAALETASLTAAQQHFEQLQEHQKTSGLSAAPPSFTLTAHQLLAAVASTTATLMMQAGAADPAQALAVAALSSGSAASAQTHPQGRRSNRAGSFAAEGSFPAKSGSTGVGSGKGAPVAAGRASRTGSVADTSSPAKGGGGGPHRHAGAPYSPGLPPKSPALLGASGDGSMSSLSLSELIPSPQVMMRRLQAQAQGASTAPSGSPVTAVGNRQRVNSISGGNSSNAGAGLASPPGSASKSGGNTSRSRFSSAGSVLEASASASCSTFRAALSLAAEMPLARAVAVGQGSPAPAGPAPSNPSGGVLLLPGVHVPLAQRSKALEAHAALLSEGGSLAEAALSLRSAAEDEQTAAVKFAAAVSARSASAGLATSLSAGKDIVSLSGPLANANSSSGTVKRAEAFSSAGLPVLPAFASRSTVASSPGAALWKASLAAGAADHENEDEKEKEEIGGRADEQLQDGARSLQGRGFASSSAVTGMAGRRSLVLDSIVVPPVLPEKDHAFALPTMEELAALMGGGLGGSTDSSTNASIRPSSSSDIFLGLPLPAPLPLPIPAISTASFSFGAPASQGTSTAVAATTIFSPTSRGPALEIGTPTGAAVHLPQGHGPAQASTEIETGADLPFLRMPSDFDRV